MIEMCSFFVIDSWDTERSEFIHKDVICGFYKSLCHINIIVIKSILWDFIKKKKYVVNLQYSELHYWIHVQGE